MNHMDNRVKKSEKEEPFEMLVTEIKKTHNLVTALQQVVQKRHEELEHKIQRVQDSIDGLRDRLENPP